jgi:hypothetical protein
MDFIYINRIVCPKKEYTLFSAAHRTFSKVDHILGYEASLNKYKKIEIAS